MTSERDSIETSEFLRRRKLRLQQVREQSKDIAKKLRERASAQTIQNIINLDAKKEKEYIEKQEKVVLELEELYSKQKHNIGDSHKKAFELNDQGYFEEKKLDKSRQRAKTAAAVLREQKQGQLDKQKKLLQRKILAREIANEISRDKTKTFPTRLLEKSEKEKAIPDIDNEIVNEIEVDENKPCRDNDQIKVTKSDMATQWDSINLKTPDWEPSIPPLPLRDRDNSPVKPRKPQRMDLFAVSEEMPSSLRRDPIPVREYLPVRPSLTLVSEFLHNRRMRLREPEPIKRQVKKPEDFHTIKQTILRSRASKDEGMKEACQVHDTEVKQVPSWKAGPVCCCVGKTLQEVLRESGSSKSPKFKRTLESMDISLAGSPSKVDTPKPRGTSPILKKRVISIRQTGDGLSNVNIINTVKETSNRTTEGSMSRKPIPVTIYSHSSKESKTTDSSLSRKNPVTVYNHALKDCTKVQKDNEVLVIRNDNKDEDAFTKAMKKSSTDEIPQKEIRPQDNRSRIAISKQNVDKEYKDTMAFLNNLAKTNNTRPNKKAFMDDAKQRSLNETRQHKMNCDFRKMQKERQHGLQRMPANNRRTKSPSKLVEDFEERSFQYSWKPVPDYDTPCGEAHSVRERSNSVRFHDDHHEYLQHSNSPPTKDKHERRQPTTEQEPDEYSTATSDFEDDSAQKDTLRSRKEEHILVKSVLEAKERKKKSKLTHETVPIPVKDKEMKVLVESRFCGTCSVDSSDGERPKPLNVKEGIYKAVSEKAKGDNIISKRILQSPLRTSPVNNSPKVKKVKHSCKKKNKKETSLVSADVQTEDVEMEDGAAEVTLDSERHKTVATNTTENVQQTQTELPLQNTKLRPSGVNSATSHKSSGYCESKITEAIEANFVKVLDEGGEAAGKFYIGASGFVNDQSYEVVIQLRKKNAGTQAESKTQVESTKQFEEKGINVDQADVVTESINKVVNKEEPENYKEINVPNVSEKESSNKIQDALITEKHDPDKNEKLLHYNNHKVSNNPVYITNVHVTGPMTHMPESNISQTKQSKSVPRNMMSSSASTTYMSPPDNIRPTFLRINSINQDTDADVSEINECEKKCDKHSMPTFRSTSTLTSMKFHSDKRKSPETPSSKRTQSKCSHKHKHATRSKSHKNTYVSPYSPRALKICKKKSLSERYKEPSKKSATPKPKIHGMFKQDHSNRGQSNLNPIVKNYVNKVLHLNKEGLRAMEVMNQDCSYVPTPSSSVVNIPNNLKDSGPKTAIKISLGQITEILKQQIIDDISKDMNLASDPNSGDSNIEHNKQNKKAKSLHNRKKSIHKVKTLYISKNIKPSKLKYVTSDSNDSKPSVHKKTSHKINPKDTSDSCDATKNRNVSPRSTESTKSTNSKSCKKCVTLVQKSFSSQSHCHLSAPSSESTDNNNNRNKKDSLDPTSSSTQTIDNEMKIVKLTPDKLENMQKIADLTEKCTQRLTNLAKILEEVRKNKSAAYNPLGVAETSSDTDNNSMVQTIPPIRKMKSHENLTPVTNKEITSDNTGKHIESRSLEFEFLKPHPIKETPSETIIPKTATAATYDNVHKIKSKPPPALANINLKNSEECPIPHELSTVIEVDSPMSLKTKSSSTNQRNKTSTPEPSIRSTKTKEETPKVERKKVDHGNSSKTRNKLEMMDLNKFNEIMLKPFMTLEEYAKQCNIGLSDEGSNLEDLKAYLGTDDMTSLQSENSLPDVIAELLKRKLIREPFKFDTPSHINSTTASSESSVSVFALSKMTRDKKNEPASVPNKDTSDSLSVSSNPDLENAFKNLGLGWASSTLKKTKERLALSSSSSSSSSKLEMKPFKQTDIGTSVQSKRKEAKGSPGKKSGSPKKRNSNTNIEQQTSTSKIMTVKEFLENELAERITFSQSRKDETDQFITLYDTKLPEEMRNPPRDINDSLTNLNRVRTSTPVQMFKSSTYDSSSSGNNNSNGLFNMDELSSVKGTSSSAKNHTTSDKYDLTIPNLSLRSKKDQSDSKNDS